MGGTAMGLARRRWEGSAILTPANLASEPPNLLIQLPTPAHALQISAQELQAPAQHLLFLTLFYMIL